MSKKWLTKQKIDEDTREVTLLMSNYNAASFNDYKKENPTKAFEVRSLDKKVSVDLRGYYFGGVIPVIRRTCAEWENLTALELHEVIKKMLFYFEAYNPITKRVERFGRSVMADKDWNSTPKAMYFLDIIREYLILNGEEMPDNEEYKRFINSAPMHNEK